ncbi:MAG TPA: hypothetical protein VGS80_09240 [Ktedonobacterales bacterium]|nr:hypothetical protein [Ktedonobacterales bacterium]
MQTPERRCTCAGAILAAALMAVALAGCVRVDRSLALNADGSGSYTLTVGFREPQPGDPTSISPKIVTPMEHFGAHVRQEGGTYRRSADQTYAYWTYTWAFASPDAANRLLQEGPQQWDPNHTPYLFHDALTISEEAGSAETTYHVAGWISLADPQAKSTGWRDARESIAITLAGGVSAHQGGTQAGDTVTYTIGYNQAATVDVTGTVTGAGLGSGGTSAGSGSSASTPAALRLVGAGALLMLSLLLVGMGGWLLRGARRK